MITVSAVEPLRRAVAAARDNRKTVGLVPTMGCLHDGHRSLITAARGQAGFVVVSIFVNPLQFGPGEDLERYPRTPEADAEVCLRDGVDLLFMPDTAGLYAADHSTRVDESMASSGLCGARRPGHFTGVATVVAKLFNMVQPDVAVFGQKDLQQVAVIRRMARDLSFPVRIVAAPTVREHDGLAMSSRNRYMDAETRRRAAVIYRSLQAAAESFRDGERDAARVCRELADRINQQPPFQIEYAEAVDRGTMQPVARLDERVCLAVAVRAGALRLIDNLSLA